MSQGRQSRRATSLNGCTFRLLRLLAARSALTPTAMLDRLVRAEAGHAGLVDVPLEQAVAENKAAAKRYERRARVSGVHML